MCKLSDFRLRSCRWACLLALGAGPWLMGSDVWAQVPPEPLSVYAAGSLRGGLTDVAQAFEATHPTVKVTLTFGASGLLKDRIEAGASPGVFASANMAHPQALSDAGRAGPVMRFARNAMCALARPGFAIDASTLVSRLLDPAVRVATSTPKADPAGDYAWQVFDRIEQDGQPGAATRLKAKALQLTGGPNAPMAPADRSVYGSLMAAGAADVFLIYCTNASVAAREQTGLSVLPLPDRINVSADYGVAVLRSAPPSATDFVEFLLGADGQTLLARHGFAPR